MTQRMFEFSILIVCDAYLQRLNCALRNWIAAVRQSDTEILISSSRDDDGVRTYVDGVRSAFPELPIRVVPCPPGLTKLKYQETLAGEASGRVLIFCDADIVFPTSFLDELRDRALADHEFAWINRRFMSRPLTYEMILGTIDTLDERIFAPSPLPAEPWSPLRRIQLCPVIRHIPQGYCHVYTANTFSLAGGFGEVEVEYGRYGAYASHQLRRMQELDLIRSIVRIDSALALHLWHGDDKVNWDGAPTMW